jgi:8-oxo-dGTP pyrophosphatase MutT (NUDIX family)
MKELPKITLHCLGENLEAPTFLKVKRQDFLIESPEGVFSPKFPHDIVERKCSDAVVICAIEEDEKDSVDNHTFSIWLRNCIRPAVASSKPFPNEVGNVWELPAGLIEPNEDPVNAVIRETKEELGFDVTQDDVVRLGKPMLGAVGLCQEMLYFYLIDVTNKGRSKPTEDGSVLEQFGICNLFDQRTALKISRDLKTEIGIRRVMAL